MRISELKFPLVIIILIITMSSFSQKNQDTLIEARRFISENRLDKAESYLEAFTLDHNTNLEAHWLLALVYNYQNKNIESIESFKYYIKISPGNKLVMLDLARVYYKQGDIRNTLKITAKLLGDSITRYEALKMEAFSYYWLEKFNTSLVRVSELKKINPSDKEIDGLLDLIRQARMVNISLTGDYSADNQPLTITSEKIEVSKKISFLLKPSLEFRNINFSPNLSAHGFSVGNDISMVNLGALVQGNIGVFRNQGFDYEAIGKIQIKKKVTKFSNLIVGFNRQPYLGTLASTNLSLMQKNYFANFEYSSNKLLTLNILYNNQIFPDQNHIKTFGLWMVTREFKISDISFMLGYGFNYSDAEENTFTPINTLEEILADETLKSSITGIYEPYFTPERQIVNSGIGVIKYKPSKKIELGATFNIGLLASHRNPYFYLDSNAQNSIHFVKKYALTDFSPMEIKSYLSYKAHNKLNFRMFYNFQSTYYYSINNLGLELTFKF